MESTSNASLLHEVSRLAITKECLVVFLVIDRQVIVNARHNIFSRKKVSVFIDKRITIITVVVNEMGFIISSGISPIASKACCYRGFSESFL